MRLIDADALLQLATYYTNRDAPCITINNIESAPTIDAIEVVRCKDCRYECGDACLHALGLAAIESPKCYCAYGSRKEKTDAKIH